MVFGLMWFMEACVWPHDALSVRVCVASVSLCSVTLTDVQCLSGVWCSMWIINHVGISGPESMFLQGQVNRKAFWMDPGAVFVLSGGFCERQCWGMLRLCNVVCYCGTNDVSLCSFECCTFFIVLSHLAVFVPSKWFAFNSNFMLCFMLCYVMLG